VTRELAATRSGYYRVAARRASSWRSPSVRAGREAPDPAGPEDRPRRAGPGPYDRGGARRRRGRRCRARVRDEPGRAHAAHGRTSRGRRPGAHLPGWLIQRPASSALISTATSSASSCQPPVLILCGRSPSMTHGPPCGSSWSSSSLGDPASASARHGEECDHVRVLWRSLVAWDRGPGDPVEQREGAGERASSGCGSRSRSTAPASRRAYRSLRRAPLPGNRRSCAAAG
jgi:hypothetical protein